MFCLVKSLVCQATHRSRASLTHGLLGLSGSNSQLSRPRLDAMFNALCIHACPVYPLYIGAQRSPCPIKKPYAKDFIHWNCLLFQPISHPSAPLSLPAKGLFEWRKKELKGAGCTECETDSEEVNFWKPFFKERHNNGFNELTLCGLVFFRTLAYFFNLNQHLYLNLFSLHVDSIDWWNYFKLLCFEI